MLWVREDETKSDRTVDLNQAAPAEREVPSVHRSSKPAPADELHFHQVAGILRRRSPLIVTIAAVGTALAAVVGLLISPKYTAIAQLVVEPPAASPLTVAAMDESIDTHLTLLGSRDHLERVVESLSHDPQFQAAVSKPKEHEATAAANGDLSRPAPSAPETTGLNELGRRLNIWIGALRKSRDPAASTLEEFERNTRVNQERRSRIISAAFTSASPEKAAAFANRMVEIYVEGLIEQKQASALAEMARLDEQIAETRIAMERTGIAVQEAIQQRIGAGTADSEAREVEGRLQALERHAAASAQKYGSLLRRQKEIRQRQETITPDIAIHALASVPTRPSSHNPILFIFPAFMLFIIGGSFLAVVLEQLDRGLRRESDIRDALGISCIGLVPHLPGKRATPAYQHLLTEPFSPYAEAIRSAVATLQLVGPARAPKVILISSSVPKEGKTTLAWSLAACVALFGRRVLLVDFDFRQGSVGGHFDGKAERTIPELHPQGRSPAKFIEHVAEAGFDYLPMHRCRLDPLVFFAGEQMLRLVRQLRDSYDCVVIDGPPLLGTAEARLLPSVADKLLFVVKWGTTRRDVAQNALSVLRDAGCLDKEQGDLPVAIVTQVDLKKHARYRYGDAGECLVKYRRYYSRSVEA